MENYIGRIVVLVTPILAGVSGWLSTWCAENLPGAPNLDGDELTAIFVAGALAATAAVREWLVNRGKHERGEV